jgi:hypothetical protein
MTKAELAKVVDRMPDFHFQKAPLVSSPFQATAIGIIFVVC